MIFRLRAFASRLRGFFAIRKLDGDFEQELESHLDLLTEENIRAGMSPREAERAARIELGSPAQLRESHHDQRTLPWLESLAQDVRFALRMLRKNPGYTAVAVLTLALGIGANTAIFSVLNATLFFSLPYPQPNRIVFGATVSPVAKLASWGDFIVVDATYNSWETRNHSFSAMAAYDESGQTTLTGGGEPERLHVVDVTPGLFPVLGVQPALGRAFYGHEGGQGEPATAILSDRLWRSRFAANPGVIGQPIELDNQLYTVVGVMPKGFQFPEQNVPDPDVLLPLDVSKASVAEQSTRRLQSSLGRLKPGLSLAEAQADLDVISQQDLKHSQGFFRAFLSGGHVELVPLRERLVGKTRPALLVLWGAVGFLLLIACVNVANLVLARATAREREIAVRIALGANRHRIARQLITENLLIAFFGAAAGLGMAYGVVQLVRIFGPNDSPRLGNATIDLPVLAFTAFLAAGSGVMAGLGPARMAWRFSATNALKEGSHSSTGRSHLRLRSVLMTAEIAMALILVIGSGLLVRSFLQITGIDLGFNPDHVLTADLAVPRVKYSPAEQRNFVDSLLERVRSLPGVVSAAASGEIPMSGFQFTSNFQIDGQPALSPSLQPRAHLDTISPGFFETMGIPVIAGRDFEPSDAASTGRVTVVSQALVRRYFPLGDALGHELLLGPDKYKIVGIVGDIRQGGLLNEPVPTIFRDYAWSPFGGISVLIRSSGDPTAVVAGLRAQVQSIDSGIPIFDVATMDERLSQMEAAHRFDTIALGVFALVGLLLAALGSYGVIAYSVADRAHEIGIRMALGASDSSVLRMVIGKTLALAFAGVAIGVSGGLALTRYLQSQLYHVRADDPSTFALASGILILVALLAGYLPARRAMRVDPVRAMRCE